MLKSNFDVKIIYIKSQYYFLLWKKFVFLGLLRNFRKCMFVIGGKCKEFLYNKFEKKKKYVYGEYVLVEFIVEGMF